MSDDIQREVTGSKGRYVLQTPEGEAELTYSIASPELVIADHTFVPEALNGQGIAGRLLARLLADAEAEGFRIMPLCPYVNAQRKRHPEWAPLFSV